MNIKKTVSNDVNPIDESCLFLMIINFATFSGEVFCDYIFLSKIYLVSFMLVLISSYQAQYLQDFFPAFSLIGFEIESVYFSQ